MIEETTQEKYVGFNFNSFKTSGIIDNETETSARLIKNNLGDIREDLFEDTKVHAEFSEARSGNRETGEEENEIS